MDKSNYSHSDLLLLSSFGKIGPVGFKKISTGSLNLSLSGIKVFLSVGIKPNIVEEFITFRANFDIKKAENELSNRGIKLVSVFDDEYPPILKEISDPPFLLYVLGDLKALSGLNLAVVGSRRHSHYGKLSVEKIIPDVVSHGITIVSGLAYGIDAIAHQICLNSDGNTVAVVGCGLDAIYPTENRELADKIIENSGAIISEYAIGTAPLKQHFPARNRIISGISRGVLVVECDIKSGAMITAAHAIDQNRDIFAIPGAISSPFSAGPNKLIKMGARLTETAQDIIESYDLAYQGGKNQVLLEPMQGNESLIFDLLSAEPTHIDLLIEKSKLKSDEVGSALLFLEMKGLVRNIGAANYIKR